MFAGFKLTLIFRLTVAWTLVLGSTGLALAQTPPESQRLAIENIRCKGNESVSCAFILGYTYLTVGSIVDEEEVQSTRLRLGSLRNFESVNIYLERGSARGRAIVIIEVAEASPIVTEWTAGTVVGRTMTAQLLGARASHLNLFGKGKILDVGVGGFHSFSGPTNRWLSLHASYADPHLFDSKRYFFSGSLLYEDTRGENRFGSFSEMERLRLGATVGRRLWDFSYLTVGYAYQASLDGRRGAWQNDGTFEFKEFNNRHALDVIYGWSSEDDYYFPTRGSQFHLGFGWDFGSDDPANSLHLGFRKTWRTRKNSFWTFRIADGRALALTYGRPIGNWGAADLKRGRWYVEPGLSAVGFNPKGNQLWAAGLKVGIRLELESLGLLDLHVFGSTE